MASQQSLKDQLRELAERRAVVETEINESSARLKLAGVGMDGKLVDNEGFPRADIDIPQIRADRHKVITLTNDHKELTNQMEHLLHKLHAQTREDGTAAPSTISLGPGAPQEIAEAGGAVAIAVEARSSRPFAVVDSIAPDSPASQGGIQLRDLMMRFGSVTGQTPNTLQAVAKVLQESEGRRVEMEVLRNGDRVTLFLEPKKWGGRGLLGCHLAPL